jgi:putative toxin-antitoxin system antitoxin component (TIGR02293 family)
MGVLGTTPTISAGRGRNDSRGHSCCSHRLVLTTAQLSRAELAQALGIPERTLARRKREGVLGSEESSKLLRLARGINRAAEVFENSVAAIDWLKSPNATLGGNKLVTALRLRCAPSARGGDSAVVGFGVDRGR